MTSDEIRAAMEYSKIANAIDIEDYDSRTAEGTIDTLATAVRELYEALLTASSGRDESKLLAEDWDATDEVIGRYRAALEEAHNGTD